MIAFLFLILVISYVAPILSAPLDPSLAPSEKRDSKPNPLKPAKDSLDHGNDNTNTISMQTFDQAGGGIPNTPSPATITQDAADNLQFAVYLLNLQSTLYHAGIANMTSPSDPTNIWSSSPIDPITELATLTTLAAQTDVHIATLSSLLSYFGVPSPPSCTYTFSSVTDLESFFHAAQHLSTISLSTLLYISGTLASSDPILTSTLLSPLLTTHSRANAFFRSTIALPPSTTPFDTPLPPAWSFTILSRFVLAPSCPSSNPYTPPSSLGPLPLNPPPLTPIPPQSSSSSSSPTITLSLPPLPYSISPPVRVYLAFLTAAQTLTFSPATVLEGGIVQGDLPQGVKVGSGGVVWVGLVGKDGGATETGGGEALERARGSWVAGPVGVEV